MAQTTRRAGAARADEATGVLGLGTLPAVCAVVTAINALYILLVTIGNITDFGTNYALVQHVLSMDTANFGAPAGQGIDPNVAGRAITNQTVQRVAYVGVIVWEALTAVVLVAATVRWLQAWRSRAFDTPRRLSTIGLLMLVILFFGGFIAVGGEWFQMWRSTSWNGLEPAFRYATLALFSLVLVNLPSPEWRAVATDDAIGPLAR